jgi:hypothetical protein
MNRRTVILLWLLVLLAGCCPWADWQPCRALVTVQDSNGQPIDATVILINRVNSEEVSRTDCPGSCIVELPDLFHNGEWSSSDGLVLRAEAAGKLPQEKEFICYWDGMMWIDGGPVHEAVAMELNDSP